MSVFPVSELRDNALKEADRTVRQVLKICRALITMKPRLCAPQRRGRAFIRAARARAGEPGDLEKYNARREKKRGGQSEKREARERERERR